MPVLSVLEDTLSDAPDRTFPIIGGTPAHYDQSKPRKWLCSTETVPWRMLEPVAATVAEQHGGQSLERLAQRGGLSPGEACVALAGVPLQAIASKSKSEWDAELRNWIAGYQQRCLRENPSNGPTKYKPM